MFNSFKSIYKIREIAMLNRKLFYFFRTTNMAKVNTYLGMTVPISLDGPKTPDVERTQALIKSLEPHGCFETESELSHRMEVLATLNTLIKDWIKDLSIEKNMPADVAETIGGHVYTFGSYRLGTVNPKLIIPFRNCWLKTYSCFAIYGLIGLQMYGLIF